MPAYGSFNFGITVVTQPGSSERGEQINAYPGLNGVERLDQGFRGCTFTVTGLLVNFGRGAVEGMALINRQMIDGNTRSYIDDAGQSWGDTLLVDFQKTGRVRSGGLWSIYPYSATFRALSPP